MSDLNKWRHKIGYSRPKTPSSDLEERNTDARPSLSRSFLSFSREPGPSDPTPVHDQWSADNPLVKNYVPDIENMAQSLMIRLMSNTHEGLPANLNAHVMYILEEYRNVVNSKEELLKEKEALLAQIDVHIQNQQNLEGVVQNLLSELQEAYADSIEIVDEAPCSVQAPAPRGHSGATATVLHLTDPEASHRCRAKTASAIGATNTQLPTSGITRGNNSASIDPITAAAQRLTTHNNTHITKASVETLDRTLSGDTVAEGSLAGDHLLQQHNDRSNFSTIDVKRDVQAITTLGELMAERRGMVVNEAVNLLVNVYCDNEVIPVSSLDGTSSCSKGKPTSCSSLKNAMLSQLRAQDGMRPSIEGGKISPVKNPHILTPLVAEQQESLFQRRQYSFEPGQDMIVGYHKEQNSAITSPISPMTIQPSASREEIKHEPLLAASGTSSASVPRQPPPIAPTTVRKISMDRQASKIPSPSSKPTISPTPRKIREGSAGSINTIINRTEAGISDTTTGRTSVPTSRRTSAQFPPGHSTHSGTPDLYSRGGRRTSTQRGSRELSSAMGSTRWISDSIGAVDVAVAAARAAEEKAEERGKTPGL